MAAEGGSWWLVSPELLKHAKLEIVWQTKLLFEQGESLKDLHILGNRIYAQSNHNYIVSLDKEKGSVIFERSFAPIGFTIVGPVLYKDEIISVVGSELVEVNPEFGTEIGAKLLEYGVVCPVARNSSYFYLSGTDGRIHALRADDKVQIFEVSADNDSMITSIIADENFVAFGTEAGNVASITPDGPKQLWQFDAAGGIAGPIVRDGESFFFASKDTNVYRVDMIDVLNKKFVWKYQTGAVLDRAPRVTREVVYQYVLYKGLSAINRESGKLMWEVQGGIDLLAELAGKAYVIAKGKLVVMDNKKAKRLYSVNFAGISKYTANLADSKIYIANKTGRIACLQPVE
jgi:outer membrane protein assembly factor BamB